MEKDTSAIVEKYNLLAAEKYGKLHGSAIHLAITKTLTYDIFRQMKHAIVVCSNDARSYYDMIVHVAAFLALRCLSIPKNMIIGMLHTIQQMEHSIPTFYGDSKNKYCGSSWRCPSFGTIQSNDVSPIIWAVISNVLFLALRKKIYGGIFRALITNILTTMAVFAYVNNTDLL